jgi:sodium-dependent dicarboxylate transporter 2/3/5
MFLFIGSFILARAIFLHRLDRRLAFGVLSLRWVGAYPSRILFAYGAVTAFMSAWISNTATTAMMFAIGMSILGFLFEQQKAGGTPINRRYATGLMLMTSFAASIGGLATPIGTPPNLIGLGFIRELLGREIPFVSFSMIGVPVVVLLFLFLYAYLNFFCRAGTREIAGSHEMLERQRRQLGPWTVGQRSTLAAFLITIALWIVPGVIALTAGVQSDLYKAVNGSLPEAVAALLGGIVLLYGGGFALGVLSNQTKLADAIGNGLASFLPLEGSSLLLLVATTLVATLISEATSNTASATIVVPVAISIARAAGADPLEPALGAMFGASLGFMLPVSTPCNAIVFGSGHVPLTRMIRYGFLLDVAGVAVIVTMVRLLAPLLRTEMGP